MNSPGTAAGSGVGRSRPHRDRDQVEAVVDVAVGGVDEVEVVGGHRRDVGEQLSRATARRPARGRSGRR